MLLNYRTKNICAEIAPIEAQQLQTKLAQTKKNALTVDELVVRE